MADTQSGTTIPRTQLLSFSRDPSRYTGDEGKKSEEEEPVDSQKPIFATYCCEIWSLVHTQTAKSNANDTIISALKE